MVVVEGWDSTAEQYRTYPADSLRSNLEHITDIFQSTHLETIKPLLHFYIISSLYLFFIQSAITDTSEIFSFFYQNKETDNDFNS
jgi:hypothetical protein